MVVAHRGLHAAAPGAARKPAAAAENTLAAFRAAVELGVPFELDCRLCATGELVVMHDASVDRTTPGHGRVDQLTMQELQRLGVPTLVDALTVATPSCPALVELKCESRAVAATLAEATADELGRLTSAGNRGVLLAVQSFSADVCTALRGRVPCAVELLADVGEVTDPASGVQLDAAVSAALQAGAAALNLNHGALTADRVARLNAAGLRVSAWTANTAADLRRAAACRVDRLITDHPALALRLLR